MRYDPKDPSNARLAGLFGLWFVPVLLGGIGLISLIAGIAVALFIDLGT